MNRGEMFLFLYINRSSSGTKVYNVLNVSLIVDTTWGESDGWQNKNIQKTWGEKTHIITHLHLYGG